VEVGDSHDSVSACGGSARDPTIHGTEEEPGSIPFEHSGYGVWRTCNWSLGSAWTGGYFNRLTLGRPVVAGKSFWCDGTRTSQAKGSVDPASGAGTAFLTCPIGRLEVFTTGNFILERSEHSLSILFLFFFACQRGIGGMFAFHIQTVPAGRYEGKVPSGEVDTKLQTCRPLPRGGGQWRFSVSFGLTSAPTFLDIKSPPEP